MDCPACTALKAFCTVESFWRTSFRGELCCEFVIRIWCTIDVRDFQLDLFSLWFADWFTYPLTYFCFSTLFSAKQLWSHWNASCVTRSCSDHMAHLKMTGLCRDKTKTETNVGQTIGRNWNSSSDPVSICRMLLFHLYRTISAWWCTSLTTEITTSTVSLVLFSAMSEWLYKKPFLAYCLS